MNQSISLCQQSHLDMDISYKKKIMYNVNQIRVREQLQTAIIRVINASKRAVVMLADHYLFASIQSHY